MDLSLSRLMEQFHGVCRLRDLLSGGADRSAVEAAVATGELLRIRKGLYALPQADPVFVEARRTRSLVTCISAAELYGLWVLHRPSPGVSPHLWRPTGSGAPDAVVHRERRVPPHPHAPVAGLADVVIHALRCLPELEALVIAESAVKQKGLSLGFLQSQLRGNRNGGARAVLDLVDDGADSLLETIARTLLRKAGFHVQAQVWLEGIGWVDLLIEGWIIVELDGRTHEERLQRGKDRVRDRAAQLRGLVTLRYGYADVVHRPELIVSEVTQVLSGRLIMGPPSIPTGNARGTSGARRVSRADTR